MGKTKARRSSLINFNAAARTGGSVKSPFLFKITRKEKDEN